MRFTVYVHTNKVNGKKYVGATTQNVKRRWANGSGYTEKGQPIFHAAIEKYGWDGFWHDVIGVASKEDMYALEQQLIALYNTTDPMFGYNSQTGGDRGFKLSDEVRNKMSEANSGENNPMYGKRGELSPTYGKHPSEETRKKLSEAKSGEKNPRYGKRHTDETRRKMSEANSGENNPMYGKRGEKHPMYGKHHTDETRKKLSIPICQYSKDGKFIREWHGATEASNALGIVRENISSCCGGRIRSAGGYTWRYKNKNI